MRSGIISYSTLAFVLAGLSTNAFAADAGKALASAGDAAPAASEAGSDGDGGAIIVTGTRRSGLQASNSPAPIEVINSSSLGSAGRPDLNQALNQAVPSLSTQGFGGDLGNFATRIRLRGLNPNHTLILVNGKRRHSTSVLNLGSTGGFGGAAAPDLAFIPVDSIDHVEVLTDGAAAQYGSDAIAGVVNIILKNAHGGGSLTADGGAYGKGDGQSEHVSGNIGLGNSKAFFNLAGELRYHNFSDRGTADQRVYSATNLANSSLQRIPGYPHLNQIYGDPKFNIWTLSYNAGIDFGSTQFYSFGSYGQRNGYSRQNYRFPSIAPSLWPQGFTPQEVNHEEDYQIAAGFKGTVLGGWNWDLSTTYGSNDASIDLINSANTNLITDTGTSPTNFHNGEFTATEWTTNLDVRRAFEVGLAGPLNVALGGEFRRNTFQLQAGDYASSYKGGSASFPGYAQSDAGAYHRSNGALYIDLAAEPVKKLQVDLAGRWERYSDFGAATVGKATARYDFNPVVAIRGTISTGFRAPTLVEEYYSATGVTPTSGYVRLPPNKAAAQIIGIQPLRPEHSQNYSLGLVFHPAPRLTVTVDAYQIRITNRILNTGNIYGIQNGTVRSQLVTDAITANGNTLNPDTLTSTYITTAVNGATTRTRGIDLLANYSSDFGSWGHVDWSIGANYNETKATSVYAPSAQIAASGQTYLDKAAISYLETAAPRFKATFGAVWGLDRWTFNLHETIWGKSSAYVDGGSNGNYVLNTIGTTGITDLEISYRVIKSLTVSVGANNLFDVYPDKINPVTYAAGVAAGGTGVATTSSFGAFGINGGYYYAKARLTF